MEGERTDRRIRKTKARLRGALTELLRTKDVKDITATELTELADVNRGTFYGHYKDIYDMLEQLEEETLQEFRTLLDAYPADMLRGGLRPILTDVYGFIRRNMDLAAPLLTYQEGAGFLERFKDVVRGRVAREWSGLYRFLDEKQREYYLSFLVGGVVGLIQGWMEGDRQEDAGQMAALTEALILHGVEPLGQR